MIAAAVPPPKLSSREANVLLLTSRGETCADIAETLGLSEETVRQHIKNTCRKLDAVNKLHAVVIALRHGLIPSDKDS